MNASAYKIKKNYLEAGPLFFSVLCLSHEVPCSVAGPGLGRALAASESLLPPDIVLYVLTGLNCHPHTVVSGSLPGLAWLAECLAG